MFKKLTFVLIVTVFATTFLNAQTSDPNPYCLPTYAFPSAAGTQYSAQHITFGTLDEDLFLTDRDPHPSGLHYIRYIYHNDLTAPILTRGQTYTLTVTTNPPSTQISHSYWIDWDQSGTFEPATEGNDFYSSGPGLYSIDITIPPTAVCGETRLRIAYEGIAGKVRVLKPQDTQFDPCFNIWQYPTFDDFNVFINDPGNPTNPDGTPNADCSVPVELSKFTATATMTGVQLDWRTESEIENLGFVLERKTKDTEWTEIANYKDNDDMLGQGTTSSANDYTYTDNLVEANTTYEYRLADVDYNGVVTYHSTREVTVELAPLSAKVEEFTVLPAYPNPFNPRTTIRYALEKEGSISIVIYDITGKLITTLLNSEQTLGWHSITWNGTNQHGEQVPAGIYISRISSNSKVKTAKLMLLK